MSAQIDLAEVERKSFATRFQDGIVDIWMGIILVAAGLGEWASEHWMAWGWLIVYGLVCALGFAVTWSLRRFIASPRLGRVRLGPAGKRRQGRAAVVMVASLVFSALLVALTALGPGIIGGEGVFASSVQVGALVAAWMLVLFSLASFALGSGRGYLIGLLFALGLGLGVTFNDPWLIVAAGAVVVVTGLVVFVRFVRETPLPPREAADAAV